MCSPFTPSTSRRSGWTRRRRRPTWASTSTPTRWPAPSWCRSTRCQRPRRGRRARRPPVPVAGGGATGTGGLGPAALGRHRGTTAAVEELDSIFVDPVAYADRPRGHATAAHIREEAPILKLALDPCDFCLVAHLARLKIRSLFQELLPRLEHIELAGEPTWIRVFLRARAEERADQVPDAVTARRLPRRGSPRSATFSHAR